MYIGVLVLTGYAKANLEKETTRNCEASTRLRLVCAWNSWKSFVQRFCPDINKKVTTILPIIMKAKSRIKGIKYTAEK